MPSVAVIGAGVGGLTVLKSMLEEGLDAVAFDTNPDIGGIWAYREQIDGHPTVMKCTVMNSSKEISAFSDFPPPASMPNFLPYQVYHEYLKLYAKKFRLMEHIRLRHLVEAVRPTADHSRTGRWDVTVLNLDSHERKTTTFDNVAVCTGKHSKPRRPKIPGLDRFKGQVCHSSEYKTSKEYKGKKVLVVGIGNSAADIAVELSSDADKVYLSTRTGAWLFGRFGKGGLPGDVQMFTRYKFFLMKILPYDWACNYLEKLLSLRIDHKFYKIQPAHRALSHYPTITDELHLKLGTGKVFLKSDIKSFHEDSVSFKGEDGETTMLDKVVLATGYEDNFPFLDKSLWPIKDQMLDLFLLTFPAQAIQHSMAFVGMAYAFGPQAPAIEMQGRWIARVFSGKCKLPPQEEMVRAVQEDKVRVINRFGKDSLLNGQAEWLPLLDQIAGYIGAMPNLWRIFFTDPHLFYRCTFGPCLSYAYRLEGPHSWPGARQAIMDVFSRVSGKPSDRPHSEDYKKNC